MPRARMGSRAIVRAVRALRLVVPAFLALALPAAVVARDLRPSDIGLQPGYQVDVAVTGLAAPTMVAFDEAGRMLIAESGYDDAGAPKVSRVEADGSRTVLAEGPAVTKPVTAVAAYRGLVYVVAADTVSTIDPSGTVSPILTGLPGLGDHQANQLAFRDEALYLSIGTVTNSGVVGPDNAVFGWLEDPAREQLHDVPCEDVTLAGVSFDSEDPRGRLPGRVTTTAYSPYGTALPAGTVVPGNPKCNGAILRANLDGTGLEVFASGLRNPYGLEFGADGALYATMHGFDARGSRPVENAWDCIYRVEEDAWYGWPDFACDVPVTDARFRPPAGPQPRFVLSSHPTETPPAPIATFDPHAATNGFAFSPGGPWGPQTDAFVALFGDFTPATGTVDRPQGVKVVRVDTTDGSVQDFLVNRIPGEAAKHGLGGLEHPSDVTFGPDGAMYVADWGVARISTDGIKLEANSGVVWRITAVPGATSGLPVGIAIDLLLVGLFLAGAVALAWGPARVGSVRIGVGTGIAAGIIAGAAMGVFMMAVVSTLLTLPWYAAPRVLATMVMGRAALDRILEFEPVSFIVGTLVLVVLSATLGAGFALLLRNASAVRAVASGLLYGLGIWAALQFFILPLLFPLVSDKGFPPGWYAVSFGLFGLVLGGVLGSGWLATRLRWPVART